MSGSKLLVHPQKTPLRGSVTVPGDKSISHRAVMMAAIAGGVSSIRNWLPAGDTLATLGIIRALGIHVEESRQSPSSWDLQIEGKGQNGLHAASGTLNCLNAGTCMRLMAGILAGQSFPSVLDGSPQLRKRPMHRIIAPLREMGAIIDAEDGRAPIHIVPGTLNGISYRMRVASAQVKSAVLLAGLYASGNTRVFQPGPARDHTERMLLAMGAVISTDGGWVTLSPTGGLRPLALDIPGDISSATFPAVAAAIVPHSEVSLINVGANGTRTGILDMLLSMGAQFSIDNERITGGEPAVDLTFRFDELHGAAVGGDTVVRGIDEFPIWAVAASQASGESTVGDAAELRVKEVDRISVLGGELRKMGAKIKEHPDGFSVVGPTRLRSAVVDSHGDHRLGMALAVAGLLGEEPTTILDAGCIADSFPGFVTTMQELGARMEWVP